MFLFFIDLDFDNGDKYFTLVINVAGGDDSIEVTVAVRVTPVNEHTPVFTDSNVDVSLDEDAELGTIVTTMEAHDLDIPPHDIVRYSISTGKEHLNITMFWMDDIFAPL